jgi:hypothetical protein
MVAINSIDKNGSNNNKWIATDEGKKWVEKIVHKMPNELE